MFGFKNKSKAEQKELTAPADGMIVSLDQVPDPVFSEKILGDGGAIIPVDGTFVAPVDGVVSQVADTLHAYGITTQDGLDILIHVGIDTVNLAGEGFKALVKEGEHVSVGTPLVEADLDFIKNKGYDLYTPVLITNMDHVSRVECREGDALKGKTPMLFYSV